MIRGQMADRMEQIIPSAWSEPQPDRPIVWRVQPESIAAARAIALLDAGERQRASRYLHDWDRNLFIRTHAALRIILSRAVRAGAADLEFVVNEWGKPALAPPHDRTDLEFSVSHSGEIGLIALARAQRIGVDLEQVRPVENMDGIARRMFGADVAAQLAEVCGEFRLRAFFGLWTAGEALAKATGLGLAGFGERCPVEIDRNAEEPIGVVRTGWSRNGEAWVALPLRLGSQYCGSLVTERLDGLGDGRELMAGDDFVLHTFGL
jgi:4'-phosphopantetheinyl transferase